MTKWFDTNYHYIVPEFAATTLFALSSTKPMDEFKEALALGIKTKPVIVGPVTYLSLGKVHDEENPNFDRFSLLSDLVDVYCEVLVQLRGVGCDWVQLDEPVFALDLDATKRAMATSAYAKLAAAAPGLKLMVATYFGDLRDNLVDFVRLPVAAIHVDVVRAPHELDAVLSALLEDQTEGVKSLSIGLVDGRNVWRTNLDAAEALLLKAVNALGRDRVMVAPSCSLLHSPCTLRNELKIDAELKTWLAFAEEKLVEVVALANKHDAKLLAVFTTSRNALASRTASARVHRADVHLRTSKVVAADFSRKAGFPARQLEQRTRLKLPAFPTTTIGSFPQTAEVRAARAQWKARKLTDQAYDEFVKREIAAAVMFQEAAGLDMLVHGEFERNDMVEYFGECLDGFAFTSNGWVQSFGSRCVKPPVVYGDVARPKPMTVHYTSYAQSLTSQPMKGMLTGPVTVLQWSFVRDDQPRKDTCLQIALALRDEVLDLEKANIAAIQIDEPALREGLPLRRADWQAYLQWAGDAFRLSASGVRNNTQIHTHMCYAEFNDIIGAIAALDADVITIETSRSAMELLNAFATFHYPNEIGPGVWDIHSPRVPPAEEMAALMDKAAKVLPKGNLWVNPDCGLKTRGWAEVKASLENMVAVAKKLRAAAAAAAAVATAAVAAAAATE